MPSVTLAAALAEAGQRVLLVDLDPQGNATMGSGIDKHGLEKSVYHVLVGMAQLGDGRTWPRRRSGRSRTPTRARWPRGRSPGALGLPGFGGCRHPPGSRSG